MAKYRLLENNEIPGLWCVQFLNGEGQLEETMFTGPNADRRAAEYQAFKNGVLAKLAPPVEPKVESAPVPAPKSFGSGPSFTITVVNDKSRIGYEYELLIYPSELSWTYDQKRRRLTAQPKDPIEILKKKDREVK